MSNTWESMAHFVINTNYREEIGLCNPQDRTIKHLMKGIEITRKLVAK